MLIKRLLAALESLDAAARGGRGLRPDRSHLSSPGHLLLMTRFGPLDILGMVGSGRGYDFLRSHAVEMDLAVRVRVHVLSLEWLIRVKEETGGEKDRAVLPVLRRTLEEKKRGGDAD
jgi:hypothetical protein